MYSCRLHERGDRVQRTLQAPHKPSPSAFLTIKCPFHGILQEETPAKRDHMSHHQTRLEGCHPSHGSENVLYILHQIAVRAQRSANASISEILRHTQNRTMSE